jgi:16S rRNA processing protein RimM
MPRKDLVEIGKIGRPFGVRGEMRIIPFTESFDAFERSGELFINGERREVQSFRIHKGFAIIGLEGISDPETARDYTGFPVSVPRSQLPPTEEDEYYWCDLIGLEVSTMDGMNLGVIDGLIRTSANDVIQVQGPHGEVLLPMVEHVVLEVDLEKGRMVVDPLEGLIPDRQDGAGENQSSDLKTRS